MIGVTLAPVTTQGTSKKHHGFEGEVFDWRSTPVPLVYVFVLVGEMMSVK
jgi:hypothetical protein